MQVDERDCLQTEQAVATCGVLLVDKPAGVTSFRIIQCLRRVLGIKKIGHAGTLDPFATGLLVVCVGRGATRHIDELMGAEKEYEAVLQLGVETDTQDPEGTITARRPVPPLSQTEISKVLGSFVGDQLQIPPRYSALKHKGKPLYHYARQGIDVVKEARVIRIESIDLLDWTVDTLSIRVRCGKGTYIRTLAADIGTALGCGAYLTALRRTKNGIFSVDDACDGKRLCDQLMEQDRPHLQDIELVLSQHRQPLATSPPSPAGLAHCVRH